MGREFSIVRAMTCQLLTLYDMYCRFSQSMESKITFEMFDKGLGPSHSYGTVEKTVRDLLGSTRVGMLNLINDLLSSANDTPT